MATFDVELTGGAPWGFSMVGGSDFNQPLNISKVINIIMRIIRFEPIGNKKVILLAQLVDQLVDPLKSIKPAQQIDC